MRKAVDDLCRQDGSGMAFAAPAFWWRRCWTAAPRATWPKPRARSTVLADVPADEGLVLRDIMLLRLRALLARARGDEVAYRDLVNRYRAMAESLGFEGHIAMGRDDDDVSSRVETQMSLARNS